jgi:osmoprotectant transport system substrate-binding protein
VRRAALALACLLSAAACAADLPDEDHTPPADALVWDGGGEVDLEGLAIAVGSQEGAEQEVLGWIATESLIAAGADVTDDIGLGDVQATREAQLAGLIDLYWESTGTGWLALLREIGPSPDAEQLYEDVRDEDLEENAIVWLPPAPADVGRGIIAAPSTASELGIGTLSELAAALDDADEGVVVCVSGAEQPLDPAGLAALAGAAQARIRPRLVTRVPAGRLIDLVEDGTYCPFGLVDRIDPDLEGAVVGFIDDDLGAFVTENPSVTVREDTFEEASGLEDLFAPVSAALDTATVRDLAQRVTVDEEDPRAVAREWLVEAGLAEPQPQP